jgi:hypothetical protein
MALVFARTSATPEAANVVNWPAREDETGKNAFCNIDIPR